MLECLMMDEEKESRGHCLSMTWSRKYGGNNGGRPACASHTDVRYVQDARLGQEVRGFLS